MIHSVLQDLPNTHVYINDIVTDDGTWEAHLASLEQLFQRLSDANLTVNLVKSDFCCATVTYLGHVIGHGKVAPVEAKMESV